MTFRRGKVWWYEFVFRGQRIRESSGSSSKTVARQAEEARRRALIESANGIVARVRPLLFRVAASEWLQLKRPKWQPSTYRIESKNVDHLGPAFGALLLIDITATGIARYQSDRIESGAAGKTVNLELATLRAILRRHRLWSFLQPEVSRSRERDDVGTALSLDEETRLLGACQTSRSQTLYPAVRLALHTGLRRSELLTLRWSQIDLERKQLTVGGSKTVAGAGRIVPLNATAMDVLTTWAVRFANRKPDHALFPSEKVGVAGDERVAHAVVEDPTVAIGSIKEAWETAKRRSGVLGGRVKTGHFVDGQNRPFLPGRDG
jgi:integrase